MAPFYAYTSNQAGNTVSVIDTSTDTVVTTIPVAATLEEIRVSPDNSVVAVASNTGSNVHFISTTSLTEIGTPATISEKPYSLQFTPNSATLYVGTDSTGIGLVSIVDVASQTETGTISTTGVNMADVAVSPDGATAYTASQEPTGPVTVIDTGTNTVTTTISAAWSTGLAITPDGTTMFATELLGTYQVNVIDLGTNTITGMVPTGVNPAYVAITPDGTTAFVTNNGDNTVTVFDVGTLAVITTITDPSFNAPLGLCITPDGAKCYVANAGGSTVTVIDVSSHAVLGTVAVGSRPQFVSIVPVTVVPPANYPGATFIPTLFIPQKGKVTEDYTSAELMADWLAIEVWSQRWLPTPPTLFFSRKGSDNPKDLNANWLIMEEWVNQIIGLKAPYVPLLVPRKNSNAPFDLDIDFLAIQNWGNRIAHGVQ